MMVSMCQFSGYLYDFDLYLGRKKDVKVNLGENGKSTIKLKSNAEIKTNIDGMSVVSNVMRRKKSSAIKTPVSCPNITKLCNNDMGGVAIMNQQLLTGSIVKASVGFTRECFLISQMSHSETVILFTPNLTMADHQ